jgi:accessory gene regulator protein AgrB
MVAHKIGDDNVGEGRIFFSQIPSEIYLGYLEKSSLGSLLMLRTHPVASQATPKQGQFTAKKKKKRQAYHQMVLERAVLSLQRM